MLNDTDICIAIMALAIAILLLAIFKIEDRQERKEQAQLARVDEITESEAAAITRDFMAHLSTMAELQMSESTRQIFDEQEQQRRRKLSIPPDSSDGQRLAMNDRRQNGSSTT